MFRAIKGVFSLLTLAYFFTEKSRCQDAHPQPPFYEWTGKFVARGVSMVVKEFASRLKTYGIQTEKVNTRIQVKTAGSPGESRLKLPV